MNVEHDSWQMTKLILRLGDDLGCANKQELDKRKHRHAWINPKLHVVFTTATIEMSPYNCDFANNMI